MRSALAVLILTWAPCSGFPLFAQSNADHLSPTLTNAGMEDASGKGGPAGWKLSDRGGGVVQMESSDPFAGAASARLDSTAARGLDEEPFTKLMQSIEARDSKGKKVRFRAAVRTADLADSARVQMWFRVDREPKTPGERNVGAFDNRQERPINASRWKHYDIVLPVDADAQTLNVGIFIGCGGYTPSQKRR